MKKIAYALLIGLLCIPVSVFAEEQEDDLPTPPSNEERLEQYDDLSKNFDISVDGTAIASTFAQMKDTFTMRKSSIGEITYPTSSEIYKKFQKDVLASEQGAAIQEKLAAYQNYLFNDQGTIKEYDSYLSYIGKGNTDTDYSAYLQQIREANKEETNVDTDSSKQYLIDLKNYMNGLIDDEMINDGSIGQIFFNPSDQTSSALEEAQTVLQIEYREIKTLGGY